MPLQSSVTSAISGQAFAKQALHNALLPTTLFGQQHSLMVNFKIQLNHNVALESCKHVQTQRLGDWVSRCV